MTYIIMSVFAFHLMSSVFTVSTMYSSKLIICHNLVICRMANNVNAQSAFNFHLTLTSVLCQIFEFLVVYNQSLSLPYLCLTKEGGD